MHYVFACSDALVCAYVHQGYEDRLWSMEQAANTAEAAAAVDHYVAAWCGVVVSGVRRMNEVNTRRARLVPGWVTVFGRVYHLGM